MNVILSADRNWAIGRKNKLLVRIPQDMRFFRETTRGRVVAMGRKTLESLPEGKPLKDRVNVVLTRNRGYEARGGKTVHSLQEMLDELRKYPPEEVFVIGGARVYEQLLPYCDKAYVTRIDRVYEADAYFPDLDKSAEWEKTKGGEEQTYFDLEYAFDVYERKKPVRV